MNTLRSELALSDSQARAALGAARAVLEAGGAPVRARGARLLTVLCDTLELGFDWRAVPAATPAEACAAFRDPAARRALADALVIPACIEGEVTDAGARAAREFADALGVRSHWVALLPAIRAGRTFPVQRRLVRSSPDGRRLLARTWQEEGLRGVWNALRFMLGVFRDDALAARFRALRELPVGTLGRAFHDHLASRQIPLPGERNGLPEKMIHHDLMHVLNGYDTDPAGECEIGGFYTGFTPGDPFTFCVTALTTFHLGMRVSPAIVTPARGAFDPARVLAAFLRGRRLNVDVMGRWDYWSLMPLPIAEVRARLGIGDPAPADAVVARA